MAEAVLPGGCRSSKPRAGPSSGVPEGAGVSPRPYRAGCHSHRVDTIPRTIGLGNQRNLTEPGERAGDVPGKCPACGDPGPHRIEQLMDDNPPTVTCRKCKHVRPRGSERSSPGGPAGYVDW